MLWFDLLKLMHCAFRSVILQISSRCYDDVESFLNKARMRLLIKILKGLSRINLLFQDRHYREHWGQITLLVSMIFLVYFSQMLNIYVNKHCC